MRRLLAALLLAFAAAVAAQEADRAYADVVAARAELQQAEAARKAGEEPLPGERQGIATQPGQGQRSRLTEEYRERQKQLEARVEQARARLDNALKRWNELR